MLLLRMLMLLLMLMLMMLLLLLTLMLTLLLLLLLICLRFTAALHTRPEAAPYLQTEAKLCVGPARDAQGRETGEHGGSWQRRGALLLLCSR